MPVIVVRPEERPWWGLAASAVANTVVLLVGRLGPFGSPFGFAWLPFLLGHFVLSGVLAGVAVRRLLPLPAAALVGVVVGILAAAAWGGTGSDEPLLPRVLPWIALGGVAWAVTARRAQRTPAAITAGVLCVLWVVGVLWDAD